MKYYCSIPWTGFSNEPDGRAQPCCLYKGYITDDDNKPMYVQDYTVNEIFHSNFMKNLREEFRLGNKPDGCSTCWADEQNGYSSKRIIYNRDIKHDPVIDWNKEPEFLSEFQLIINNSCNLKCRSCTPSHSTQWQKEIKILTGDTGYPMPKGQSGNKNGKLWEDRFNWYKNLRRLEVVGGEPFYNDQWIQIFNELIELNYSKNIDITMTTNATFFYENVLEKLYSNFKSVSVGLSIDGKELTYEYLRHPAKWNDTYNNMKKYHDFIKNQKSSSIQINYTIGWLNAFDTPEFFELIKTEFPQFKIWNNIIHSPVHMPIWATSFDLKKDILKKWSGYNWEKYHQDMTAILNFMNSKDITDEEFKKNIGIFKNTDAYRNEDILLYFPHLEKYIRPFL